MVVTVATNPAGAAAPCDDRLKSVLGEDGRGLLSGNDIVQISVPPVDTMRLLLLLLLLVMKHSLLLRRLLRNRRSGVRYSSHSDPVSRK